MRFLAALAVLFFHYAFRGFAADGLTQLPYPWLAPFAKYGHLGVNLFFMISGFVILMTASHGSTQHFVISRAVRLYPAFWICCSVTFLVTTIAPKVRYVPNFREYLENLTMFSGFLGVPSVDSAYWSLFVEMKFYVLVFLVLWFGQLHRIHALLGIWLAATIVTVLWPMRYVGFLLVPEYSPYFIAGATFYLISKEGGSLYKVGLLATSYALMVVGTLRGVHIFENYYHTSLSGTTVCVIHAGFFLVLGWVAMRRSRDLGRSNWQALGALTYPLYLLHQNIGFVLFNALFGYLNVHVIFWGTTALMLGAAYLVHILERVVAKSMKEFLVLLPRNLEIHRRRAGLSR